MDRYRSTRKWAYDMVAAGRGGKWGMRVKMFVMILIVASVISLMIETVDSIAARGGPLFFYFEAFSVAVFTVEYGARIWGAVEDPNFNGPISGRLKCASRPLVVIDLLAILPFYIAVTGVGVDLRFLRILRLLRIFRILKLARYTKATGVFGDVLRAKKYDLGIAVFANGLLIIVAASVMYFIEHPHQPETFSSIPATIYWAIITVTTVGYGDVTPVTPLGQVAAGVIAFLGIGLVALPAGILASGFMDQASDNEEADWEYCPHCGERLEQSGRK